jgi:hypothetical protein
MTTGHIINQISETLHFRHEEIQWSGADDPAHKAENWYWKVYRLTDRGPLVLRDSNNGQIIGTPSTYGVAINGTPPLWTGLLENQLLSKVVSKLRSHDFNAGIVAGEMPKTLESVVGSARAILVAVRELKRGNLHGVQSALSNAPLWRRRKETEKMRRKIGATIRNLLRAPQGVRGRGNNARLHYSDISGTWLALTYGWLPLMQDIEEGMNWIESKTSEPRSLKLRCRKSHEEVVDDAVAGGNYNFFVLKRIWKEYRISYVEAISTPRSLGLLNPLSVAWELVPFSFVVDWFIPIGTYLDNIGFLNGLDVDYAWTMKQSTGGTKVLDDCHAKPYALGYPHGRYDCPWSGPAYAYFERPTEAIEKRVWFNRWPGTEPLNVPLPGFKTLEKAFSLPHIQNAAALVTSLIASARK